MVIREHRPPSDPFCTIVFTVAAEYALRAMTVLASIGSTTPLSVIAIADATLIPAKHLDRVLGRLASQGFVRRKRGPAGGYSLARPAPSIQLLDVIRAFQPLERIRSCPLGRPEHCGALCPLHRRMDESIENIIRIFGGTSLHEFVNEPLRPPTDGAASSAR